jgi:hypothetical protein
VNHVERLVRRFDSWQQGYPLMAFAVAVMKKFGHDHAAGRC